MDTDPIKDAKQQRHEGTDVDVRALAYWGASLFLVLIVIMFSIRLLFVHFAASQPLGPPPTPFTTVRALPVEPRLQVNAAQDWQTYWKAQQDMLNHYGWVDKQQGVVRVPIDRAMDLLLQRGLPVRQQSPPLSTAEVPTESGGPDAATNAKGASK